MFFGFKLVLVGFQVLVGFGCLARVFESGDWASFQAAVGGAADAAVGIYALVLALGGV